VTRVLVIDDHPIVLQGSMQLLESAGADEIEQPASASEGFRLYRKRKPDVIVVDLAMQAGSVNGLAFLRRLRRIDQQTPVLVLTMHRDPIVVGRALEAGATGYVLKDAPPKNSCWRLRRCGMAHPTLAKTCQRVPRRKKGRLVAAL
jgi:two-component system invasion response regulator UvrY